MAKAKTPEPLWNDKRFDEALSLAWHQCLESRDKAQEAMDNIKQIQNARMELAIAAQRKELEALRAKP